MKKIEIPESRIDRIMIKLVSDSPLITGRYDGKDVTKKPRNAEIPKDTDTDKTKYLQSIYLTPDNKYGFPTMAFKKSVQTAATILKKSGSKNIDGKKALMGFFLEGPEITELETPGPKMRKGIARNTAMGKNTPVPAVNAQFDKWAANLVIRYNSMMLSPEQIIMLFQEAGKNVGIGVMRPETQGASFGLFHVEEAEGIE